MDDNTIGMLIAGVLGAFGVGGVGGRFLLNRNATGQSEPLPAGAINPGLEVTGQHKALELISDSFVKTSDEIKSAMHDTTDKLSDLVIATTKLEAKVEGMPMLIENATLKAIRSHESNLHGKPGPRKNLKSNSGG